MTLHLARVVVECGALNHHDPRDVGRVVGAGSSGSKQNVENICWTRR
jgi:hypothetical protein